MVQLGSVVIQSLPIAELNSYWTIHVVEYYPQLKGKIANAQTPVNVMKHDYIVYNNITEKMMGHDVIFENLN